MYEVPYGARILGAEPRQRVNRLRLAAFLVVFIVVAGGGLAYDFLRPAVYRATARISIEPPGSEDAVSKAQFAVSEALAMRKAEIMSGVVERLGDIGAGQNAESLARQLNSEAVPQTSVIELRADGDDRGRVVSMLGAWIEAYQATRKQSDKVDEGEALTDARHALQVAEKAIEAKRREIDAFRQQHGIASVEREENPSAARLKGLNSAMSDASAKEVAVEAKLKAIEDGIALGKGFVRTADRTTIANLELRAVDLREKLKELEHDFTAQYLALDPKYKALKSNLARIEQQVEQERQRSQATARAEAQEELAGAQRTSSRLREQIESMQKDSQSFSGRFLELKRMTADLDQLQEARREQAARLQKVESARRPAAVKLQILMAPAALPDPVDPQYLRDAGIALGAGILIALLAVGVGDYLLRTPAEKDAPVQPVIQIAYPVLGSGNAIPPAIPLPAEGAALLGGPATPRLTELGVSDVAALWKNADSVVRRILALSFIGVSPGELGAVRWNDLDSTAGSVHVPGASAREVEVAPILREELAAQRADQITLDFPILADGTGRSLGEGDVDTALACLAHDAGLRQPETVTARILHFTYAAYLVRQGMRMSDLHSVVGRLSGDWTSELMRLSAPSGLSGDVPVDRVYPTFRSA